MENVSHSFGAADMDNEYPHRAPSDKAPVYTGGFPGTPYAASRPPNPEATQPDHAAPRWFPSPGSIQPDHAAPRWSPSPGYVGHQAYGFSFPASSSIRGGPMPPPLYGFDPSVPPPPFDCPPPGHFPNTVPSSPVNAYSNLPQLRASRPSPQCDIQPVSDSGGNRRQEYADIRESGALFGGPMLPPPPGHSHHRRPGTAAAQPEDEAASQRRQDAQWLRRFLQNRGRVSVRPQTQAQQQRSHHSCVPDLREALYGAAQLVSALEESCQTLKNNLENECVWTDSYRTVLNVQRELQDRLRLLRDGDRLIQFKAKVSRVGRSRARAQRASQLLQLQDEHRQEHTCEKEAAIDSWRMKRIHEVEERKKEQELKLAADSVLCEVRKKQSDVKRMQDILRSLEKLRRLRKEAASRKGIATEQECDQVFVSRLEELRRVMKRRTVVYSAEEKALMVMLEGEQEEERRREQERRAKKERERQLQRKHRVDAMLFGDELPADSVLQPFREYYTHAQLSLHSLIQVRREWDVFVVAGNHPDGSLVPQSWILPEPPSDQDWASALHTADSD